MVGRLDEEHRKGLVNDFFKNASEQIIILPTNEEIDSDLYDELKDFVSQIYLLDYDFNKKKTIIQQGSYFFDTKVVV